jgi:hypothetical protein
MNEEEELLKKIKEEAPLRDLEVSEKATKLLKGKRIALVLVDAIWNESEEEETYKGLYVNVDEGKVILVLEDGIKVVAWNSEWGEHARGGILITEKPLKDVL